MKTLQNNIHFNRISIAAAFLAAVMLHLLCGCSNDEGNGKVRINTHDTIPFMTSHGITTYISDSGYIRYHVVTEQWDIYNNTTPPRWSFVKGIMLEKFSPTFTSDWLVQADTAFCYDNKLWNLRGNVFIRNQEGTRFHTEELYWDLYSHEIYSQKYMKIITPDRELEGNRFRSNETMTIYEIYNSAGSLPVGDFQEGENTDTTNVRQQPSSSARKMEKQ